MGYQLSSFINFKGGHRILILFVIFLVHIKPDYDSLSTCCYLKLEFLKPSGRPSTRRDSFHRPLNQDTGTYSSLFYISLSLYHIHHATLAKGE